MFQRKNVKQAIPNVVDKKDDKKASAFQKYAVIKLQCILTKNAYKKVLIEFKKLDQSSKDCRSRQITQQTNYTTSPDFQLKFLVSVDIITDKQINKTSSNKQNETYPIIDDISKLTIQKLNLKQQIKALAEESKGEIQKLRDDCRIQNQSHFQNIFLCQQ